jgi:hypothetical protein
VVPLALVEGMEQRRRLHVEIERRLLHANEVHDGAQESA